MGVEKLAGRGEEAGSEGKLPGSSAGLGQRRSGLVLYPALSRRAGGLSLGVNLFPDGKRCSFDCAYCEVLPGPGGPPFSITALESELGAWAASAQVGAAGGSDTVSGPIAGPEPSRIPLDIAFAGDGEPTLSPFLGAAIESVADARRRWPSVFGASKIVLITNSTGFLDEGVVAYLHRAVERHGLEIWAKLDAGTEAWYRRIDRRGPDFGRLFDAILSFARRSTIVIQSMFCAVVADSEGGTGAMIAPPESEIAHWARRMVDLAVGGARIGELQVYTQSRDSPHRLTSPLEDESLMTIARRASKAIAGATLGQQAVIPIRVFGRKAELDARGGLT